MRFPYSVRTFCVTLVAVAIVVLLRSPSIVAQTAAMSSGHSLPHDLHGAPRESGDAASSGDVIVSASQGVYVYSNTLKLLAQIDVQNSFGNPLGLALDSNGDLYVANLGTNGIPVYKDDYHTLSATLSEPYPSEGIAVAKNGVVGVIDYPPSVGGHVTFYGSGRTTPCAGVSLENVSVLYQGAFDPAGNFYVTGQDTNSHAVIAVIGGGCSATGFTLLSTANNLGQYIFGIQITRFGKIAVGDQNNNTIYTYNPPINGTLGQPISETVLPPNTPAIYQFGFTARDAFFFVPVGPVISKYAYPTAGKPLQTFGEKQQLHNPNGLVVAPSGI